MAGARWTETEEPNWSSNTRLDVRSPSAASAFTAGPLGAARMNGIATSADHTRIRVSYVGRLAGFGDRAGGVIELPAF